MGTQRQGSASSQIGITLEQIAYYSLYPEHFIRDVILEPAKEFYSNIKFSPDQVEILNAVSFNVRVAVRSGHGIGKTSTLSWLILWFLFTRHNARVVCTGPKFEQLKDTLWAECAKWLAHSPLKEVLKWGSERIHHVSNPAAWWAIIRTAKEREALAGQHAEHLLFIVDEASGVKAEIFESVEGALTGPDNRIIICGNPTQTIGYFFDSFNRDKESWFRLHFDSEKSPIVSRAFVARMAKKWGRNSDIFRVRVKGDFPRGNPDAFITLEQVEMAKAREVGGGDFIEIGVDVARFGDDLTSVQMRLGYKFFPPKTLEKSSTVQTANFTIQELRKLRKKTGIKSKVRIKVDDTGIGGGVTDILNENKEDNIEVVPINFASSGNEDYANITSVMWGELRDAIDYIELPDDDDLTAEISARKFKLDSKNRIVIEDKTSFKKEHDQSPDRSDSLVLCLTQQAPAERVLKGYRSTNADIRYSFAPEFNKIGLGEAELLASIHQGKDLIIYGICAIWVFKEKKLYIYNEIIQAAPVPEDLVPELVSKAPKAKIFGNDVMFKENTDSVARVLRKHRLKVSKNERFNLHGTIMMANKMFYSGQIAVHDKMEEADTQFREWIIRNGKPDNRNAGCCLALCNLVAYLKEKKMIADSPPPPPYSKQRQSVRKNLKRKEAPVSQRQESDWML